jgi:hypothetical protein
MNTEISSPVNSNRTDEKSRQVSCRQTALEYLSGKGGSLRYIVGIVSCAAVLVLGLGEHYTTVVPLKKELLAAEVHSVARQIDATVKLRSEVISMAAGRVAADSLLSNGRLDKFLATVREHLPDFRSLEIINDRGEIVAMIGDLPLSQAGIPMKAPANRFVRVSSDMKPGEGLFVDDPVEGYFTVTCRHLGPNKTEWFSRSRFSRDSIEQLLSSFPDQKVELVRITGGPKVTGSKHDWNVAASSGSYCQGADQAEALLASPGWIVRVKNTTGGSVFRDLTVLVPSILLCVMAIALVFRIFHNYTNELQPQPIEAASQPDVPGESEAIAEDGLKEATASPDHPDSPECGVPAAADSVEHDTAVSASPVESVEVGMPLPDEIEIPGDDFVVLGTSNQASAPTVAESRESGPELELSVDEAAALYGNTEIIAGEIIAIGPELPEDYIGCDPSPLTAPHRVDCHSAVILGPPEAPQHGRTRRETTPRRATDDDFPETIELSWMEQADFSDGVGMQLEPDRNEQTQEKKSPKRGSRFGQFAS